MAATLLKAPVTFYFFVMVVRHLLTPNVYIGGRIINEANGIGNLVSLTPYSGLTSSLLVIHRHVSIRHLGFYSTGFLTSPVKRYPNSVSTFQLDKLIVSGDVSTNPGPE